jgi:hypothetical protein
VDVLQYGDFNIRDSEYEFVYDVIYVRVKARVPRLLARYSLRAKPEGCIWLTAEVRGL